MEFSINDLNQAELNLFDRMASIYENQARQALHVKTSAERLLENIQSEASGLLAHNTSIDKDIENYRRAYAEVAVAQMLARDTLSAAGRPNRWIVAFLQEAQQQVAPFCRLYFRKEGGQ